MRRGGGRVTITGSSVVATGGSNYGANVSAVTIAGQREGNQWPLGRGGDRDFERGLGWIACLGADDRRGERERDRRERGGCGGGAGYGSSGTATSRAGELTITRVSVTGTGGSSGAGVEAGDVLAMTIAGRM
jgi:hypothetical protein